MARPQSMRTSDPFQSYEVHNVGTTHNPGKTRLADYSKDPCQSGCGSEKSERTLAFWMPSFSTRNGLFRYLIISAPHNTKASRQGKCRRMEVQWFPPITNYTILSPGAPDIGPTQWLARRNHVQRKISLRTYTTYTGDRGIRQKGCKSTWCSPADFQTCEMAGNNHNCPYAKVRKRTN
jgi:hypothetical protein